MLQTGNIILYLRDVKEIPSSLQSSGRVDLSLILNFPEASLFTSSYRSEFARLISLLHRSIFYIFFHYRKSRVRCGLAHHLL